MMATKCQVCGLLPAVHQFATGCTGHSFMVWKQFFENNPPKREPKFSCVPYYEALKEQS